MGEVFNQKISKGECFKRFMRSMFLYPCDPNMRVKSKPFSPLSCVFHLHDSIPAERPEEFIVKPKKTVLASFCIVYILLFPLTLINIIYGLCCSIGNPNGFNEKMCKKDYEYYAMDGANTIVEYNQQEQNRTTDYNNEAKKIENDNKKIPANLEDISTTELVTKNRVGMEMAEDQQRQI